MEITEVRIKLTEDSDDRLQAFCSITFDDSFVVRDLKIIEGTSGPFVAMPSRKLTAHCPRCGTKNHLRANHCNQCGAKLSSDRGGKDAEGRTKLYADIAHPINSECREMIQARVIEEYLKEQELAKQPGYVSRYEDDYDDAFPGSDYEDTTEPQRSQRSTRTTEIQPREASVRPPHAPASQKPPDTASSQASEGIEKKGSFGAGILDD